jgi:hypothetical protein
MLNLTRLHLGSAHESQFQGLGITYDELRKLVKELPFILRKVKACDAYRKCLDDRDTGKVKHCYENDRRWREFFTGAW